MDTVEDDNLDLAKVVVEGSNPFARSSFYQKIKGLARRLFSRRLCFRGKMPPRHHRQA